MAATYNSSVDRDFVLALKIGVGIVSALSVIGGFLMVLTFCIRLCRSSDASKNMMSAGRLILVNLSIADIVVAATHLWGLAMGYDVLMNSRHRQESAKLNNNETGTLCDVQGALSVYSTIAAFLWTIILSFFVFATLMLPKKMLYGRLCTVVVYHVIGWAVPLCVLIVLAVEKEYGFQQDVGIAWCYTLARGRSRSAFVNTFGYDLWAYLTIILLTGLFFSVACYTCTVPRPNKNDPSETTPLLQSSELEQQEPTSTRECTSEAIVSQQGSVQVEQLHVQSEIGGADGESGSNVSMQSQSEETRALVKLIVAALILVILRIWDVIYNTLSYIPSYQGHIQDSKWGLALIFMAGVGDSAQGFANAVLFLLFTKTYRNWIIQALTGCCKRRNNS